MANDDNRLVDDLVDFDENMADIDSEPAIDVNSYQSKETWKPLKNNFNIKWEKPLTASQSTRQNNTWPWTSKPSGNSRFGFRSGHSPEQQWFVSENTQSQWVHSYEEEFNQPDFEQQLIEKSQQILFQHTDCVWHDAELLTTEGTIISEY